MQKVSEYDQKIQQSHNVDHPMNKQIPLLVTVGITLFRLNDYNIRKVSVCLISGSNNIYGSAPEILALIAYTQMPLLNAHSGESCKAIGLNLGMCLPLHPYFECIGLYM